MPRKKKSEFAKAVGKKVARSRAKRKKQIPFRNIDTNGVTYTFLANFLQCRETARLEYVEGLTQSGMIGPLEFGQLFHLGFELLAGGRPATDIVKITDAYVKNRISQEKWKSKDRTEITRLKMICDLMFPLYADYYQSPLSPTSGDPTPRGIEFHDTTTNVDQERPFVLTHTLPVSGRTIPINGRFDGILRVGAPQDLWLMENKTKSQIDSDGLTSYLPFDIQTMLYCYALETEYQERVAGIVYNVVKRPSHRFNPEKESLDQHANRVAAVVAENPHEFFQRWHVELGANDVNDFVEQRLNPVLEQVLIWWDSIKDKPFDPFVNRDGTRNIHHFVNPEGLYTKYGKSRYFELLTRGSMFGLKRRTPSHAVRKETTQRKPLTINDRKQRPTTKARKQRAGRRPRTAAR
jgi:hypothetical protein